MRNHNYLKAIYILLSELKVKENKEWMVEGFTDGRTSHISEMTRAEQEQMLTSLQDMREDKVKKMRAKIVHLLCVYGMTDGMERPDYKRINAYIKAIGKNNPKQKLLYYLSPDEMRKVLNQVEKMVTKTMIK